jgi:hypothetical protein
MPARRKIATFTLVASKPGKPNKEYVANRWTIDCNYRLLVACKSSDWENNKVYFLMDAGRMTGSWSVVRSVNKEKIRFFHVVTDLTTAMSGMSEFMSNGLLIRPRLFKEIDLPDITTAAPEVVLTCFRNMAKMDKEHGAARKMRIPPRSRISS